MVYCDSRHPTHELKDAQNLTDGHVQVYTVQEARNHTKLSQWMYGERDLGIDTSTDSSDTQHKAKEWLLCPCCKLWTWQKHQATSWYLVSMVFYVANQSRTISVLDYTDFMHKKRWKIYQDKTRMQLVENYLEVFWTGLEYWNNIWTWWTEGKGHRCWYTVMQAYKNCTLALPKSLISSGSYLSHALEYARCKCYFLPSRSTPPATARGYVHIYPSVHTQDLETWIMFDMARVVTRIGRFCFKCVLC